MRSALKTSPRRKRKRERPVNCCVNERCQRLLKKGSRKLKASSVWRREKNTLSKQCWRGTEGQSLRPDSGAPDNWMKMFQSQLLTDEADGTLTLLIIHALSSSLLLETSENHLESSLPDRNTYSYFCHHSLKRGEMTRMETSKQKWLKIVLLNHPKIFQSKYHAYIVYSRSILLSVSKHVFFKTKKLEIVGYLTTHLICQFLSQLRN